MDQSLPNVSVTTDQKLDHIDKYREQLTDSLGREFINMFAIIKSRRTNLKDYDINWIDKTYFILKSIED